MWVSTTGSSRGDGTSRTLGEWLYIQWSDHRDFLNDIASVAKGFVLGTSRTLGALGEWLYIRWSDARDFLHGMIIAWVSVASVAIGFVLFLGAPQAQDLFLETKADFISDLGYWTLFYALVILVWALPVYISARWILSHFEVGPNAHPDVKPVKAWVRRFLPPVLATSCLIALFAGQYSAFSNAPTPYDPAKQAILWQSQQMWQAGMAQCDAIKNTFNGALCHILMNADNSAIDFSWEIAKDVGRELSGILLVGVLAYLFVWFRFARTSQYRMKLALVPIGIMTLFLPFLAWPLISAFTRRGHHEQAWLVGAIVAGAYLYLVVGMTGAFGFLALPPFIFFGWRAWKGKDNVLWFVGTTGLIVVAILYFFGLYGIARVESMSEFGLPHVVFLPVATGLAGLLIWQMLRPAGNGGATYIGAVLARATGRQCAPGRVSNPAETVHSVFYALLVLTGAIVVTFVVVHPLHITQYVHRALLLPVILGLPVPLFTRITLWSTRWRIPLLLAVIVFLATINMLSGESARIRVASETQERYERYPLAKTVERWADVNKCMLGAQPRSPDACPSPIIIAAAGGASRSAFHVAGVIGAILDGPRLPILSGHNDEITDVAVSADGRRLVTGSQDKTVRVWDLRNGKQMNVLVHEWEPKGVAVGHGGSRVVTFDRKHVRVWKLERPNHPLIVRKFSGVADIAMTPNGSRVIVADNNGVWVWDPDDPQEPILLKSPGDDGKPAYAWHVEVARDGSRVITVGHPFDTIKVWDLEGGQEPVILRGDEKHNIIGIAVTPSGSHVAAAFSSSGAWVWDLKSDKKPVILKADRCCMTSVALTRDGRRAVTGHYDNTAQVWALETGERIMTLRGHRGKVNSVAVTWDGKRAITGSLDKSARVWELESGAPPRMMEVEDYRAVANRLFAISAVSGGALGAVVTYAALADAQTAEPKESGSGGAPCAREGTRDPNWFGQRIKGVLQPKYLVAHKHQPHESWKSCLQLLVSGDFVSPVFVSLVSNDPFQISLRGTRAEVLEQSWEERYAQLTNGASKLGLIFKARGDSTLAQPMLGVRRRVLEANDNNWLPVLLINGTSVTTGKRIVTSDISTLTRDEQRKVIGRLHLDAYDLHELMEHQHQQRFEKLSDEQLWEFPPWPVAQQQRRGFSAAKIRCKNCDILLSTAVTMSARFPVISPAGAIPDGDGKIIDHIVDGGYYENFGATTAIELAKALKKFGLEPSVILIDNEPTNSVMKCGEGASGILEYPERTSASLFPVLSAPTKAVFGTRTARGTHAAADLCNIVKPRFAHIRVKKDETRPDKPIPMSWWLSMRVQKYLDEQLASEANAEALFKIVEWLKKQTH